MCEQLLVSAHSLPNPAVFHETVAKGADRASMAYERRITARLAAIEAALATRGRADEKLISVGEER